MVAPARLEHRAAPRSRARGGRCPRGGARRRRGSRRSRRRARAGAASEPGRSGTRVNRTSRRPASVSWRRATIASRPASTLPPLSTTHVVPRRARPRSGRRAARRRRPRRRPRRRASPSPSQHDRLGDVVLGHDDHVVEPARDERERQLAGALDRDAVGDRQRRVDLDRLAARAATPGRRRRVSTCTPTTSTSGRCDFTRDRDAARQPAAADRDDDLARGRATSSSSSSPSVPCPATMSGSSNGCTNAMPASSARARASATHSSTDAPPMCTTAPSVAAALDLRDRRLGRHEDLARHAARPRRLRARPGVVAGAARGHAAARSRRPARRACSARRGS